MLREDVFVSCLATPNPRRASTTARRDLLKHVLATPLAAQVLYVAPKCAKAEEVDDSAPRKNSITLESSADSLGVEIADGVDGRVRIKRIITPHYAELQEGMVVDGVSSTKELVERLRSGSYPMELTFTDDKRAFATKPSTFQSLSIVSTKQSDQCDAVGTRGVVVEIDYDAYYVTADGHETLYDASSFRGTGQPYQMVLGSGDMIPGVDQGIVGMCVGESRTLNIPKILGHGARSRKLFGIPDDHLGLVWKIKLIRAESPTL